MHGANLNEHIQGFECIRCGSQAPIGDYLEGCGRCNKSGHAASMRPVYAQLSDPRSSPEGFRQWLSYPEHLQLGQGCTPVVSLPSLAAELCISQLTAKFEGANPTGSHKDRMSTLVVARAKDIGATTLATASSGNAGASTAAFASAAGLKCVVVTTAQMDPNWRRSIEFHGAEIIFAPDVETRWSIVRKHTVAGEWYPTTNFVTPAVGSNPFGIDGYRAIAFEIFADSNELPTDILVPTSRGDLLWGIAAGFDDLRKAGLLIEVPKIHAVEPFPRIVNVLCGSDYRSSFPGESLMTSIGGSTVCYQALHALTLTGGTAIAADEKEVVRDQQALAHNGLYLESSSAATLSAARQMRLKKALSESSRLMLIATSHGYKES